MTRTITEQALSAYRAALEAAERSDSTLELYA